MTNAMTPMIRVVAIIRHVIVVIRHVIVVITHVIVVIRRTQAQKMRCLLRQN